MRACEGCLAHDRLKSYFKVAGVRHTLRNAHHLGVLQVLAELNGEAWADPLQQLLRSAGQAMFGLPSAGVNATTRHTTLSVRGGRT